MAKHIPLVVDFDGTLHRGDWLHEALLHLLRHGKIRQALGALAALVRGKAAFKQAVAKQVHGWQPLWQWNSSVLAALATAKRQGRRIFVASATPLPVVQQALASHTIKAQVLGSSASTNLRGKAKAQALATQLKGPFEYWGNAEADLPVWKQAAAGAIVGGGPLLRWQANRALPGIKKIPPPQPAWRVWLKALRPHQWSKNLLVLVPALLAHFALTPFNWLALAAAFVAICACASGIYMVNDVLDTEADRRHPHKKNRPCASGQLPLAAAFIAGIALSAASIAGLALIHPTAALWLLAYAGASLAYSLYFKLLPVIDVTLLAGLYCVRLVLGGVAAGVVLSFWLLLFALFMFYGLAMAKRYAELIHAGSGRGYLQTEAQLVLMQGTLSTFMSVLVIGLYLHSPEVNLLYAHPLWLGLLCPLLLVWQGRLWFMVFRGKMTEDPIWWALKDGFSWATAAAVIAVVALCAR
ncbi:MAG TPA: UbiA family prenyltransferase [Alphaproteobacteria bacterium]|nr:UbiA family prenyltransferase [Alphaproteobacteria bacterium]